MSFIEVKGKTEAEAIERALAQLHLTREDVSVEILQRAKSGFLGIGGTPACIRVTYEGGEEEVKEAKKQVFAPEKLGGKPVEETKEAKKPAAKPAAPVDRDALRRELAEKKEVLSGGTEKTEKKEKAPRAPRAPREVKEKTPYVPSYEGTEITADDEAGNRIRTFLDGLFEHMQTPVTVKVFRSEEDRYSVYLEGEKLGQLIGRRGETLDAIQQITSYSINKSSDGGRIRVRVDAENYRAKREESLVELAQKMAAKAERYGRSVTLEPMNAYERRIIHTALQDHPRVTTYSTGTDPNRRIIIALDRTKPQ